MTEEPTPNDATTCITDASTPWLISDGISSQNVSQNKLLKKRARWTPWMDCWEFESVGRSLIDAARALPLSTTATRKRRRQEDYDGNHQESLIPLQNALNRVTVWKVRADSRLPHAVESSYQLAQCLWNDYSSMRGAEELRMSYSCAVLRAINGLADAMQQQRSNAASVAVLCGDLGIPSWLVDVRHEATHNQMPTLSVLRLAASTLLEYFHREYWLPEMQFLTSGTQPQQDAGDATASSTALGDATTMVKHLEAYQRQQAKILARNNSSPNPTQPKKSNSSGNSKATKKPAATKVVSIGLDAHNAANSDSDEDSDEEMYLDGLLDNSGSGGFWSPPSTSLGTNANRFAALQGSSSKAKTKKSKKPKLSQKNANATNKQQQRSDKGNTKMKPDGPSAHHHAKRFAKAGLQHLELAQRTALLFLVWGGVSVVEGEDRQSMLQPQGALIPLYSTGFPENGEGIKKVRQHYNILLTVLGKEWPGFLRSLMIHLIDCILMIETSLVNANDATETSGNSDKNTPKQAIDGETKSSNDKEATPERKLFFLESWVQYLVSREFVAKFHSSDGEGSNRPTKSFRPPPATWDSLEKMWYPLNSLCDRLLSSPAFSSPNQGTGGTGSKTRTKGLTSRKLADLFSQILGQSRAPHFGVVYESRADITSAEETPSGESKEEDKAMPSVEDGATADKAPLSLDEMEAILSGEGTQKELTPDAALTLSHGVASADPIVADIQEGNDASAMDGTENQKTSQLAKRPAWVRCIVWEPCSMGVLPGHPCSS